MSYTRKYLGHEGELTSADKGKNVTIVACDWRLCPSNDDIFQGPHQAGTTCLVADVRVLIRPLH